MNSNNRLKKLEADLEIQKNKSLINDKKNREVFEKFVNTYVNMLFANKNKTNIPTQTLEEIMIEIKQVILMNGSWKIVTALNVFTQTSQKEWAPNKDLWTAFDNFFRLFREEIWVDNAGLEKFWLLQLLVKDNISEHLS